jgi:hypothetical protein
MKHDVQDREEEMRMEREQLNAGWESGADEGQLDPDIWNDWDDPDEWDEE